jgi:hypothetical protein
MVKYWYETCLEHTSITKNPIFVLVGLKAELEQNRIVSYDEGQQMAYKHGWYFREASSVTGWPLLFVAEQSRFTC